MKLNPNYPEKTAAVYENEVTVGGIVTNPKVNLNDHYSDYPQEFELEVERKADQRVSVNGTKVTTDKIRVAIKRDDSIDYNDNAFEYVNTHLQEGDYIRIRGHLDTAYAWPVVVIERKHSNILWHEHKYES